MKKGKLITEAEKYLQEDTEKIIKTVNDLIELLKKYDGDMEIYLSNERGESHEFTEANVNPVYVGKFTGDKTEALEIGW